MPSPRVLTFGQKEGKRWHKGKKIPTLEERKGRSVDATRTNRQKKDQRKREKSSAPLSGSKERRSWTPHEKGKKKVGKGEQRHCDSYGKGERKKKHQTLVLPREREEENVVGKGREDYSLFLSLKRKKKNDAIIYSLDEGEVGGTTVHPPLYKKKREEKKNWEFLSSRERREEKNQSEERGNLGKFHAAPGRREGKGTGTSTRAGKSKEERKCKKKKKRGTGASIPIAAPREKEREHISRAIQ